MPLPETLRCLRESFNLTRQQLADETGLSVHAIASYENGRREPNSNAMAALEKYFHVSGAYLRGEVDDASLDGSALFAARRAFPDRLKSLRAERGMNLEDLAPKMGISVAKMSGYEAGLSFPPLDLIDRLCRFFRVSREYLLGQTNDRSPKPSGNDPDRAQGLGNSLMPFIKSTSSDFSEEALKIAKIYDRLDKHGKNLLRLIADEEDSRMTAAAKMINIRYVVPVLRSSPEPLLPPKEPGRYKTSHYRQPMSAGTGIEAGDDGPEDFMLAKQPPRGTSYVAPVSGDSMEPTFRDGDELFVHACSEIEPGQIGVFLMDGRQWVKELGDGVLVSHNSQYAPIPMTEDIRCQGLVLGVCDPTYFP